MRALACKFGEKEDAWGLAGLLHDIDVEWTEAIRLHNEHTTDSEKRSTRLLKACLA